MHNVDITEETSGIDEVISQVREETQDPLYKYFKSHSDDILESANKSFADYEEYDDEKKAFIRAVEKKDASPQYKEFCRKSFIRLGEVIGNPRSWGTSDRTSDLWKLINPELLEELFGFKASEEEIEAYRFMLDNLEELKLMTGKRPDEHSAKIITFIRCQMRLYTDIYENGFGRWIRLTNMIAHRIYFYDRYIAKKAEGDEVVKQTAEQKQEVLAVLEK